jgi:hypothetical protein
LLGHKSPIVGFELRLSLSRRFPLTLQGPSHQAVFGLHGQILTRSAIDGIRGTFEALGPLLMPALPLGFRIGHHC